MEIGRYHWMYPGSKNHQYRPVPTLGDRANPLSSPGKYSLGVHSHSNSTVTFNMICDSSFGLVLFSVLLDAFICSQGLGWKWPFKHCFHHVPPFSNPPNTVFFNRLHFLKTLFSFLPINSTVHSSSLQNIVFSTVFKLLFTVIKAHCIHTN